uniref:C2H2-type domain-containing protein n=1 Tax=Mesocestoides corti TaxID=53468 RepID=A0A5K3FUN5_MESCO
MSGSVNGSTAALYDRYQSFREGRGFRAYDNNNNKTQSADATPDSKRFPSNMDMNPPPSDDKENRPPSGFLYQTPSTTAFQPYERVTGQTHSDTSTTVAPDAHLRYQIRRPVEAWKYVERRREDGSVIYLCRTCSAVYKHKKSLNKHWKDKHATDGGDVSGANDDESDSHNESSFSEATTFLPPQLPPQQHKMRTSLRRLPQEPIAPAFLKRRRSEFPLNAIPEPSPLDLSVAKPPPPPPRLPEVKTEDGDEYGRTMEEDEEAGPLRDRHILTLLLQSALNALTNEPEAAKTTDALSSTTLNLLRAVGSILVSSTKKADQPKRPQQTPPPPEQASAERKQLPPQQQSQQQEDPLIPCPACPFVARWFSELRAHMVNHSGHRMFGCCYCPYRAKWKWDVAKHMRRCLHARHVAHLPNEGLLRMITYFAPPPEDILYAYFPRCGYPGIGVDQPPLPPPPLPPPQVSRTVEQEGTDEESEQALCIDENPATTSEDARNTGDDKPPVLERAVEPDQKPGLVFRLRKCTACSFHSQDEHELQDHMARSHCHEATAS